MPFPSLASIKTFMHKCSTSGVWANWNHDRPHLPLMSRQHLIIPGLARLGRLQWTGGHRTNGTHIRISVRPHRIDTLGPRSIVLGCYGVPLFWYHIIQYSVYLIRRWQHTGWVQLAVVEHDEDILLYIMWTNLAITCSCKRHLDLIFFTTLAELWLIRRSSG